MEGKVNEAAPQLIKQTAPLPTQKVHHTPAFPLLVAAIAAGRGGGGPMVLKLDPGCTGGGGPMLPGCMGGGGPMRPGLTGGGGPMLPGLTGGGGPMLPDGPEAVVSLPAARCCTASCTAVAPEPYCAAYGFEGNTC